jgi:hypothetical protein
MRRIGIASNRVNPPTPLRAQREKTKKERYHQNQDHRNRDAIEHPFDLRLDRLNPFLIRYPPFDNLLSRLKCSQAENRGLRGSS